VCGPGNSCLLVRFGCGVLSGVVGRKILRCDNKPCPLRVWSFVDVTVVMVMCARDKPSFSLNKIYHQIHRLGTVVLLVSNLVSWRFG
jgi:hypothetical protein